MSKITQICVLCNKNDVYVIEYDKYNYVTKFNIKHFHIYSLKLFINTEIMTENNLSSWN